MTAQSSDRIILDGIQYNLFTNSLDAYTEKDRRYMIFYEDHPNTACWRGYVADCVWNVSSQYGKTEPSHFFYQKLTALTVELKQRFECFKRWLMVI